MQLFYQPKLLVNTTQILNEEESRHCAQVLRLKSGDIINITNGNGSFFTAELIDVNHKKCVIAITQETTYPKENRVLLKISRDEANTNSFFFFILILIFRKFKISLI
jgi:16S rRNA (uracil1498-N3)-methyltransferase